METLRRRYEESLPVLRELFYTRLLSGQIRPEQVQDRAARYEIDLPQGLWTAALVHVDGLGDEGERDELLLLSVQSFLEKHFALAGCAARVVLYGDMAALLVHLDREDRLYPLLEELERLLECALEALNPGGRLAIISFHSLEDRLVKTAYARWARGCTCPPDFPVCVCGKTPRVKLVGRRPITAGEEELKENPRARSAKLRLAERL